MGWNGRRRIRDTRRGGSMLVRRRIQTPSVANGPERGSVGGEGLPRSFPSGPPHAGTNASHLPPGLVLTHFAAVDAGVNPASPRGLSGWPFGDGPPPW